MSQLSQPSNPEEGEEEFGEDALGPLPISKLVVSLHPVLSLFLNVAH